VFVVVFAFVFVFVFVLVPVFVIVFVFVFGCVLVFVVALVFVLGGNRFVQGVLSVLAQVFDLSCLVARLRNRMGVGCSRRRGADSRAEASSWCRGGPLGRFEEAACSLAVASFALVKAREEVEASWLEADLAPSSEWAEVALTLDRQIANLTAIRQALPAS